MRYGLLLLFYGWLLTNTQGQTVRSDTTFVETARRAAIARYEKVTSNNDQLVNGIEYIGYDPRLKGNAFFGSDSLQTGVIQYEGKVFSAPMLYDVVRDIVVIRRSDVYRVVLQSDRVQSFTMPGHTYVRLADRELHTGFYDLLYTGFTQFLARRTKIILVNPTSNGEYGQFSDRTTYFVHTRGHYYPVKNKKTVLAVFADQKKQLVSYARKQRIRFRPDPEMAILKLTQHYDELNRAL